MGLWAGVGVRCLSGKGGMGRVRAGRKRGGTVNVLMARGGRGGGGAVLGGLLVEGVRRVSIVGVGFGL